MFATQPINATKNKAPLSRKDYWTYREYILSKVESPRFQILDVWIEMMAGQVQRLACNCLYNV